MTRIVGLLSLTLICSTIAAQDANKKQQDKDTIRFVDISKPPKPSKDPNVQFPPYMLDIPNVIPPSPEVATLFRYSEFAVNHSSGLANINIPIYTIQYGPITLPISISYDHSGRRHGERTGSIGLGWALNTGGMISRTIHGKPDGQTTLLQLDRTASTIMSNINNEYYSAGQRAYNFELMKDFYENTSNGYDSEYDIFTYYIPGHSGKFILYNGAPMLLDNKPVKITGDGSQNNAFRITDDKGIKYTFRLTEYATTGAYEATTAWGIDKVESPDDQFTVTFNYNAMQTVHNVSSQTFLNVKDRNATMSQEPGSPAYTPNPNAFDEYYTSTSSYSYNMCRLDNIDFKTGKLEFEPVTGSAEPRINRISLMINYNTYAYTTQRICSFGRSQSDAAGYQWLNTMTWYKPDGTTVLERYSFEYTPSSIQYANGDFDYWGYRNSNSMTFLYGANGLPRFNVYTNDFGVRSYGVNNVRNPNITYSQQGILKKIIYPTGGNTEFTYEANKYNGNNIGGGLRIQKIVSNEGSSSITKTYEYGNGYLKMTPAEINFSSGNYNYFNTPSVADGYNFTLYNSYQMYIFSPSLTGDASFLAGLPVFYSTVTETTNPSVSSQATKIKYTYSNPYASTTTDYFPTQITGNFFGSANTTGNNRRGEHVSNLQYSKVYCKKYDHFWRNTQPIKKEEYINNSTTPIRTTTYNYVETPVQDISSIKVKKNIMTGSDINLPYAESPEGLMGYYSGIAVYSCVDYSITKGRAELRSVTEIDHTPAGNIENTQSFEYNNNGLLTKRQSSRLPNEIIEESISYVESTISMPTEKITYKKTSANGAGTVLQRMNINYTGNNTYSNWKPQSIYIGFGSSPSVKRAEWLVRDQYGNPIHLKKDNVDIVYIWGFYGAYPVAEIVGATYAQVKTALSNNAPESLSSLSEPAWTLMQQMRNSLSSIRAQVTIYKYMPATRMYEVTDPRGIKTTYEYDNMERLINIRNNENNLIESYDYYHKNQTN